MNSFLCCLFLFFSSAENHLENCSCSGLYRVCVVFVGACVHLWVVIRGIAHFYSSGVFYKVSYWPGNLPCRAR